MKAILCNREVGIVRTAEVPENVRSLQIFDNTLKALSNFPAETPLSQTDSIRVFEFWSMMGPVGIYIETKDRPSMTGWHDFNGGYARKKRKN